MRPVSFESPDRIVMHGPDRHASGAHEPAISQNSVLASPQMRAEAQGSEVLSPERLLMKVVCAAVVVLLTLAAPALAEQAPADQVETAEKLLQSGEVAGGIAALQKICRSRGAACVPVTLDTFLWAAVQQPPRRCSPIASSLLCSPANTCRNTC
jgi:hypothetical protein